MAGRFEVYQDGKGADRFRLKARDGRVIATGEGHPTEKACLNAVASIRTTGPDTQLHGRTA